MTESASLSPLLFVMVVVLILVWQALGYTGPEDTLLHWIGAPWRNPPTLLVPVVAASPRALMVWADDGGAGENAARE